MLGKLILLFVLVPLADLFLLMMLSKYTGLPFSIGLVIVSGIVGAYLAKRSYRSIWKKANEKMAQQQFQTDLLTDGAMVFFAAGLLLTPGFITDAVGLTLLIPQCRRLYKKAISSWFKKNVNIQIMTPNQSFGDDVVDGQVVRPSKPDVSETINIGLDKSEANEG